MDVQRIFIILVDISGYTRFIKYHKSALLHAEKIVSELMEAILKEVEVPVVAHEILGDAISMYALDEARPGQSDQIYHQLQKYFLAFWEREATLISACKLCPCDACKQVGQLKLKAVLHVGEAAFSTIMNTTKISGEDVIIAHRLLKNSVPSSEYILMTEAFVNRSQLQDQEPLIPCVEQCEGIGEVRAFYRVFGDNEVPETKGSLLRILRDFFRLEKYLFLRRSGSPAYRFRNLPQ